MDVFLSNVQRRLKLPNTNEETCWLQALFRVVKDNFHNDSNEGLCLNIVQTLLTQNLGCLPIGHRVLSVSDLAKPLYNNTAFTANLTTTTGEKDFADSNWLEEKSLILIGRLTTEPKSKNVLTNGNGVLYIEDSKHAIICEVTKAKKEWLDNIVVLCYWNFIPCATFPILIFEGDLCKTKDGNEQRQLPFAYIEVLKDCICINTQPSVSTTIPKSIPVEQYQQGFQSNDTKPFFLLQLECLQELYSVVVIFKGKQYCNWYNFLTVGEEFVFSNLKETTMNKGRPSERTVVAASSTSDFFRIEGNEPNELLGPSGMKKRKATEDRAVLNPDSNTSGAMKTSLTKQPHSLCCTKPMAYEGVITAIVDIDVGTYEIDHKFKLYTYLQPRSNFGCGWRVGASVSMHNVHMCKLEQDVLGFCCCFLSSVQITEYSKMATPFEPVIPARSYLYTHIRRLSLVQFLQLFNLIEVLCKKFQTVLRRQSIAQNKLSRTQSSATILCHLVDLHSLSTIPLSDVYADFFDSSHTCLVSRPSQEFRVPIVPTLRDIRDCVDALDTREGCSGLVGDDMYEWSYKDVTQDLPKNMVIVGYMKARSRTGQLVVCDNTAKIRCIITKTDISDHAAHQCTVTCLNNTRPFDADMIPLPDLKKNICPFVSFGHNGAILKVRRFKMIVENSRGRILQDAMDNTTDIRKYYLIFSLCDVDIIGWLPKKSSKRNEIALKTERKFVFLLRNKELLKLNLQERKASVKCCLNVYFFGEVSKSGADIRLDYKKKWTLINIVKDCSSLAYLKAGSLYYVTELCDDGAVSRVHTVLGSKGSQACLNLTGAMRFENVDNALYETETFEQLRQYIEESREISSIKDCLAGVVSKSETKPAYDADKTLYSFRGEILHRDVVLSGNAVENLCTNRGKTYLDVPHFGKIERAQAESFNLGYYFHRSRSIVLTLGSDETADQVKVYCNFSTSVHPFGLIPGATIVLTNLSRHVSQSGNVYFKFLACSDVAVESIIPSSTRAEVSPRQHATQLNIVDFSNALLAGEMIPTVSYVTGNITAVQKVHLKWNCSKCGKLANDCYCTDDSKSSVFTAEARVVIEDGSCEALLFIKGEHVKTLLLMNDKLWNEITDPKYGEVFYQKNSFWKAGSDSNESKANKVLYKHMQSTTPLRMVKVLCKQFKMASRKDCDEVFESCDIFVNGETYSTFICDKVSLNCLELSDVDHANEAKKLLQTVFISDSHNNSSIFPRDSVLKTS